MINPNRTSTVRYKYFHQLAQEYAHQLPFTISQKDTFNLVYLDSHGYLYCPECATKNLKAQGENEPLWVVIIVIGPDRGSYCASCDKQLIELGADNECTD